MEGREAVPPVRSAGSEAARGPRVLRSERTRIVEAAARCCARKGFADTTVDAIVAEAGVSRDAFDSSFADKEECFLAALNSALTEIFRLSSLALQADKDLVDRIDDGVAALVQLTVAQPSYAAIGFVQSRVAGERPHAIYTSGTRFLVSMLDLQRGLLPEGVTIPSTAAQAAFGGPFSLVSGELAKGTAAEVPTLLPDLIYAVHVPFLGIEQALKRARLAEETAAPTVPDEREGEEAPAPELPGDARETADPGAARLLDSAIELVGEVGYGGATLEALLKRAGVARGTFRASFDDLRHCFVAAWRDRVQGVADLLADRWESEDTWSDRVRACLEALVSWAAEDPAAARALMVEIQAAGPAGHRLYMGTVSRLIPHLDQGRESSPATEELPNRVGGLALGGAELIAFDEIAAGRAAGLPHLLPDLLFAVLVPFLGPEEASRAARAARAATG